MGKRVGRPSIPSSHPTKEPKYLPAPAYRHIAPQLLKIQFSGAGEKRERGGWASGGVSARSWREESSSEAKPRAPEGGLSRAEQLGCRRRANARTAGGGHRPLPHLAALLVMKADHRDVQYGPTGGAIAAAPVFLHGRPPQARKTMTATAEGGKPSNPVTPRRRRAVDFRCQRGRRMRASQGARRRPRLLQLCTAPPGPQPSFPHPLPLLPGCHLMRRQPPVRRDWAGLGGT